MESLPFHNSISLIVSCMYAGKSTELIRRAIIYHELGLKVLYINSALDTRPSPNTNNSNFSTHNKSITNIPFDSVKLLNLDDYKIILNHDVIAIDEAQLFNSLLQFCLHACEKEKKIVIVAGLNGDYLRRPFGQVCDLIPYCDSITKLHAFCIPCKNRGVIEPAHFTKRVIESKETVLIGDRESYVPVCRSCFNDV